MVTIPDKVNPDLPDFDAESVKLIQEMKSIEKEDRLLRIKNQDLKIFDKPAKTKEIVARYKHF